MTEKVLAKLAEDFDFMMKCQTKVLRKIEKKHQIEPLTAHEVKAYTSHLALQQTSRNTHIALVSFFLTSIFISTRLALGVVPKVTLQLGLLAGARAAYLAVTKAETRDGFNTLVARPVLQGADGVFLSAEELLAFQKAQNLRRLELAEEIKLQKKYRLDPQSYH